MIGTRLGQYSIDARLGAGGMGVVYRARDERLHRTVALKIVGGENAGSTPDERARLIDEARAASHLSHPHICTVYEVGEADGRTFIAMEYVDGQLLAESVPHDGLPSETVALYGAEIADALAHAHEHGVLHRDLKTANIAIGASGAKVLDFGLARRVELHGADTITKPLGEVEARVLAGTLPYVPPEILLGQDGDPRSDIWSLGVVLFEMATGELPFKGRNEFELTAGIIRAPAQPFPAHVPPILRAIIFRCLAKEPAQRYQRAGEVRAALEAIQSDMTSVPAAIPALRRRRALLIAGVLVLLAAAAGGWRLLGRRPGPWESTAGSRLTRLASTDEPTSDPALSPDGRMIAYVMASPDGRVDLYSGRVRGGARIRLTNDEAVEESPRFSPDGERIAFTSATDPGGLREIRVVPTLGGAVLSTIPRAVNPAWSPDGRLACVRRGDKGHELAISGPDGSDARVILPGDSAYPFLRNPAWSPDGRQVAIVRGTGGIAGEIWLVPAEGGVPRRLVDEPSSIASDSPTFTPDGRGIVHSSTRGGASNIWFAPLAPGKPVRLTTGPGPDNSPSIAADGSLAFINSRWRSTLEAHSLATGATRTLATHIPFIWAPAISPDGKEIAFTRGEADGTWHLWIMPFEGGEPRRLTATAAGEVYPRWTPDGRSVLFTTWSAPRRVGTIGVDGAPPVLLAFGADGDAGYADPSPDGRRVAFSRAEAQAERLYVAPASGGEPTLLAASAGATPRWSPDGSVIAFGGDRGYGGGIFVIRPGDKSARRLTDEGGWPVWWPDGRQVGYLAVGPRGDQELRVVSIEGGASQVLPIRLSGTNHPFAVTADGRTIIISNGVHLSDEIWLLEPRR
jgi:eukaryotic-like serine/threonine-protein kinase